MLEDNNVLGCEGCTQNTLVSLKVAESRRNRNQNVMKYVLLTTFRHKRVIYSFTFAYLTQL